MTHREVAGHALLAAARREQLTVFLDTPLVRQPCNAKRMLPQPVIYCLASAIAIAARHAPAAFDCVTYSTFLLEGLVEGHPVAIAFRVAQHAVTIPEQRLQHTHGTPRSDQFT